MKKSVITEDNDATLDEVWSFIQIRQFLIPLKKLEIKQRGGFLTANKIISRKAERKINKPLQKMM